MGIIGKHVLVNKTSGRIEMSSEHHSYWKLMRWLLTSNEYIMFDYEVFEIEDERCVIQPNGFEFEVVWERNIDGKTIATTEHCETLLEAIEKTLNILGINTTQSNEFFDAVKS